MGFNDDKSYEVGTHAIGIETIPDEIKDNAPANEVEAIQKLTEDDVYRISREALSLNSMAGLRILGIMFVQGCNQAGYGVDWAVIGGKISRPVFNGVAGLLTVLCIGINSLPAWHSYLNFGNSGSTYGVLNALMNIGGLVGALFYGLADVIGRRGINFIGNAIVIAACLLQGFAVNMKMFMAGR